jgi:hypothetical protein
MQRYSLRTRFYFEAILGTAALGLLVVTLLWNDWIELVFKVDPDAGNGSLEYVVCFALLAATAVTWFLARAEWRRARVPQGAF